MNISVKEMTADFANQVIKWKYNGEYSVYNHDNSFITEYNDGMHFAFVDDENKLLGYMCFGLEARVPTDELNAYDDDYLDIGLHIKPDLNGKGFGNIFLKLCIEFADSHFNKSNLITTIAKFNKRAQALCKSAGFYESSIVHHKITGKEFVMFKISISR